MPHASNFRLPNPTCHNDMQYACAVDDHLRSAVLTHVWKGVDGNTPGFASIERPAHPLGRRHTVGKRAIHVQYDHFVFVLDNCRPICSIIIAFPRRKQKRTAPFPRFDISPRIIYFITQSNPLKHRPHNMYIAAPVEPKVDMGWIALLFSDNLHGSRLAPALSPISGMHFINAYTILLTDKHHVYRASRVARNNSVIERSGIGGNFNRRRPRLGNACLRSPCSCVLNSALLLLAQVKDQVELPILIQQNSLNRARWLRQEYIVGRRPSQARLPGPIINSENSQLNSD